MKKVDSRWSSNLTWAARSLSTYFCNDQIFTFNFLLIWIVTVTMATHTSSSTIKLVVNITKHLLTHHISTPTHYTIPPHITHTDKLWRCNWPSSPSGNLGHCSSQTCQPWECRQNWIKLRMKMRSLFSLHHFVDKIYYTSRLLFSDCHDN